ncbi:MAG: Gldg family protein [Clostridiales bacterium]
MKKKESEKKKTGKKKFKNLFSNRNFVGGVTSIVIVILIIVLFFAVNILSVKVLDDTLKLSWDLTSTKKFSFDEESTNFLKELKTDVTVYCLFSKIDKSGKLAEYKDQIEFVEKYGKYDNVKIVFKDPDKYPNIISEIDPEESQENLAYGTIVIKSDKRMKLLAVDQLNYKATDEYGQQTGEEFFTVETQITNSINYVAKEKIPSIYFLTGHSEKALDTDMTIFGKYIDAYGFEAKSLNLIKDDLTPEDIVAIVGPKSDINKDEAEKLSDFTKNGGKLLSFIDPLKNSKDLENLDSVLSEYNLALEYDIVKEKNKNNYVDDEINTLPEIQQHDLTSVFTENQAQILLPESRSIKVLNNEKEGLAVTPLFLTTEEAIGDQYDAEEQDLNGPLNLGVVSENQNTGMKILAIGNSIFISDQGIEATRGNVFVQSLLTWLTDNKDEIIIKPKDKEQVQINLSNIKIILLSVLIIVVIPLLVLGIGVFVWLKRRRL